MLSDMPTVKLPCPERFIGQQVWGGWYVGIGCGREVFLISNVASQERPL